jgi:hypothetical protein
MGLGTIPARTNGQTINETWFNILRTALGVDLVPRDTDGFVTPNGGDLGDSTNYWKHIYAAALKLRANGFYSTIEPHASLAADFTMKLPAANPVSGSKMLFIDSTGQLAVNVAPDNSSLEVSGNDLRVKAGGITDAMRAARNYTVSATTSTSATAGSASYTDGQSVSITTIGRPVLLLVTSGSGTDGETGRISSTSTGGTQNSTRVDVKILRGATGVALWELETTNTGVLNSTAAHAPASLIGLDTPSAGTYTYKVQIRSPFASQQGQLSFYKLAAIEL